MGFLDDLGRKVTDAGQKTMQKTRGMSEVARINSLVSREETEVNNLYYQIGKLYVNIHGKDGEEDFVGMVTAVEELERQIFDYKKQIQEIRGIQHCEKCGAEVPKGVAFCSSCGAAMPQVEKQENLEEYVRCFNCGALIKKGMRFCTACGQAMAMPIKASGAAESPSVSEENAILKDAEKICPRCGAELSEDSVFCTKCGTKI